jgi:hypothetical protein
MGPEKYFKQSGATLVHSDATTCAPRALLRNKRNEQWLVGTDGGTGRVYFMPVPSNVKTCAEAHTAICGFDETKILGES